MKNEFSFNIDRIHIIIHKDEGPEFLFRNPSRKSSGFVYIESGNAVFENKNGEKTKVSKGDFIILWEGEKYGIYSKSGCSYIASAFEFLGETNRFISSFPKIQRLSEKEDELLKNTEKIWQSGKWDSAVQCTINIMQIYLDILSKNGGYLNFCYDEVIAKAVDYIHSNYKKNFTARNVAKHCAVSGSGLRMKFQKQFGLTVTEYRENLRIDSAKAMLLCGSFSVTEIAYELGYCDVPHFSKAFKSAVGVSPKNFVAHKEWN